MLLWVRVCVGGPRCFSGEIGWARGGLHGGFGVGGVGGVEGKFDRGDWDGGGALGSVEDWLGEGVQRLPGDRMRWLNVGGEETVIGGGEGGAMVGV